MITREFYIVVYIKHTAIISINTFNEPTWVNRKVFDSHVIYYVLSERNHLGNIYHTNKGIFRTIFIMVTSVANTKCPN